MSFVTQDADDLCRQRLVKYLDHRFEVGFITPVTAPFSMCARARSFIFFKSETNSLIVILQSVSSRMKRAETETYRYRSIRPLLQVTCHS